MAEHLVFTIFAPLGAWGTPSPSSGNAAYKASETVPTKSAVVGLLGAALGWPRERLGELAAALHVAVRLDRQPLHQPAPDYHTVRKGQRPRGRERWSRFDELRDDLTRTASGGAMLSRREYLAEGLWTVAVHCASGQVVTAADLAAALRSPVYPMYAGRKAFSLGLPPDPEVIEADGPVAALAAYGSLTRRRPALTRWLAAPADPAPEVGLCCDADYPGLERPAERWLERRDMPRPVRLEDGRVERRFAVRTEAHLSIPGEPPCT